MASGFLFTGVKVYKKRKRRKKLVELLLGENAKADSDTGITLEGLYSDVYTAFQKNKAKTVDLFRGAEHRQQLQYISSGTNAISEEEQELNQNFALSVVSLGFTIAGSILYPVLTLFSIPILLYLNVDFIKTGFNEISKERKIGIGVVDGIVASAMLVMRLFFIDALFFVLFYLSQKLLAQTQDRSKQSLINIFGEQPRTVWIKRDDNEISIPFDSLRVGDIVVVSAGEVVPVDAVVTDGVANVDQRMLTGESQPVEKSVGERVFAATLVLSGKIFVQVEKAGSDTVAAQIGEILSRTADFKSSIESQGEAIADRSALPMLAFGAATFMLLGPMSGIAVLFGYFGYNMRIIAPISVLNFLRIASQNSILVKDGRALELLKQVDTVVFDKTGTLTQDQPHVGAIYSFNGYRENDLLALAAAAEDKQTHPIARAVRQEAYNRQLDLPPIDDATYEVGFGIKVEIDGHIIRVGSERFMALEAVSMPASLAALQRSKHEDGFSLVYVAVDHQVGGAIELPPTVRPEAKQIIDGLKQRHLEIYIISGDHEKPTQHLARSHHRFPTLYSLKSRVFPRQNGPGNSYPFRPELTLAGAQWCVECVVALSGLHNALFCANEHV
jgi:Cu2+-exporting ATPase